MTAAPAPRRQPMRWARLIRRQMLWLPLVPLFVALVFGAVAWQEARHASLLERHGVDTLARVTGREARVERDDDNNRYVAYYLSYTYDAGLGDVFDSSRSVGPALYDRTRVGDEIPLRFVFHQPDLHAIESGDSRFIATIFGLFTALFGAVALALGLWMARRSASLIRAARYGEVREARVTGHRASTFSVNNVPLMQATWQDAIGQTGLSTPMRPEFLPAVDSVIVVYVDPVEGQGWWAGDF